jgi:hypothetical protein
MNWLNINAVCDSLRKREITERQSLVAFLFLVGGNSLGFVFPNEYTSNLWVDYALGTLSLLVTVLSIVLAYKINKVTNVDFVLRYIAISFSLFLWSLILLVPLMVGVGIIVEVFPFLSFFELGVGLLIDLVFLYLILTFFKKINDFESNLLD